LRQLVNELDPVDQYPAYVPPATLKKKSLQGVALSPQEEASLAWI
jgi:hypothetical protein